MNQVLILITAVLFYFIGRYSGKERETLEIIKKKMIKEKGTVGPINYITPQKSRYIGSEREKIDEVTKKLAEQVGLGKI